MKSLKIILPCLLLSIGWFLVLPIRTLRLLPSTQSYYPYYRWDIFGGYHVLDQKFLNTFHHAYLGGTAGGEYQYGPLALLLLVFGSIVLGIITYLSLIRLTNRKTPRR